ncbi:Cobalt/magnesium transport protein CorA [bioreactor metagenome]|uniref:Cobalt/magnesium transport protein CorA n=1 Tax=bioreactor metagenome TaxID=1076179 RepID=A0A644WK72_9ZZZZ|nr:magnesium/cobalt transporter CorA [Rikenellaceae bacterium]
MNVPNKTKLSNPLRKIPLLNRKKADPGSFIFTGNTIVETIDIQLFEYNSVKCLEKSNIDVDNISNFKDKSSSYWLNIYGLNDTESIVVICEKQGIHNLVIQDILDVNQRPKFQEFETYSFLTLKSIVPCDSEVITEQISFVFGANFLISFQERKADFFDHIRQRLRENIGIQRERSSDYLLFTMLESILDNYFKTISKLEEEIDAFNFTDINKELSPNTLAIIESHKKFVSFVKKSILPIKEFVLAVERGECRNIEPRHVKYFLEIKDLCLTLIDSCEMNLSSLESAANLFFSIQGHRMNQVMKTLTIVATIFIPLTFIAGIYGMNFVNMPELEWKFGYLAVWIVMVLVLLVMLIFFKVKKWF